MSLGGPGGRLLSSCPMPPSSCGQAKRPPHCSTMLLNATLTLCTFGDSILDCGRWAAAAVAPFGLRGAFEVVAAVVQVARRKRLDSAITSQLPPPPCRRCRQPPPPCRRCRQPPPPCRRCCGRPLLAAVLRRYNPHGVHPAQLLIRNNDGLFPAERGHDLASRGVAAELRHRALDGATTHGLERQLEGLDLSGGGIALVTGDACIVHCNLRAANGVWVLPHSWAAERGLGSAELRLPAACRTSGRVCPAIACLHPCRHVHQIQCQVQLLLPEAAC